MNDAPDPKRQNPLAQFRMEFGHRLAEARRKAGLSQAQIATSTSTSSSAPGHWERGYALPQLDTLRKVSELLDVSPEYLLRGGDQASIAKNKSEATVLGLLRKLDGSQVETVIAMLEALAKKAK
jgi:transcriptional regulator with XRE-family HTH domain